jgi:methyl-accepting chemotaxis protein
MSLRIKINLVLILIFLIGTGVCGLIAHRMLQDNAREEVLESASIMMESAMAVRSYTVAEIKPLLAVQQRRQFLSQTVPAYAASRYIEQLQETHPDYSYKEAALNPTNPANRAMAWEADIIGWFRDHEEEREMIGERMTPMGPFLYLSRPIKIGDKKCLACHGSPSKAPKTFVETYGPSNGFGWQFGEIVAAQVVSVPMAVPLERAKQATMTFVGSVAAIFAIVFLAINFLLHILVVRPVTEISQNADEVSLGNLEVEELKVRGKDEIASLSRSFNRMHRSLANAVKMLDEMEDDS